VRFFSNLIGEEGPRIPGVKGLFSKDFISALNILSISAMSFFALPNSPFSMKPKSPANNIWVSFFEHFFAFHLNPGPSNPWILQWFLKHFTRTLESWNP
jgi:hypothetical protein